MASTATGTDSGTTGTVLIVAKRSQLERMQNVRIEAEEAAVDAGGRLVGHGVVLDEAEATELFGQPLAADLVAVRWQMERVA